MADAEAIADELNPLTISHTAKTISCKAMGINEKVANTEVSVIKPNISNKAPANNNAAPRKPQTDKNRGMSFD